MHSSCFLARSGRCVPNGSCFDLCRAKGEVCGSALQCAMRVYHTEGLRGFYRGISASYAGVSETVIHFVIYEALKRQLRENRLFWSPSFTFQPNSQDFFGLMGAAAVSKTCASCIAYPHGELLKVLSFLPDPVSQPGLGISQPASHLSHNTPLSFLSRGHPDTATRGGLTLPFLRANSAACGQRRGSPGSLPGASGPPDSTDPQCSDRHGHLRTDYSPGNKNMTPFPSW